MDRRWVGSLNMRLFGLWALQSRNAQVAPLGITRLFSDRLRGHVSAEGYGDGGPLAQVLDELTPAIAELGGAPVGCECELCGERDAWHIADPFDGDARPAGVPEWAPCHCCGIWAWWRERVDGVCRHCRGAA